MKKLIYIKALVLLLGSIVIGSCLSPKQNNEKEILSLVFNTEIGNIDHIGGNRPITPEPPDNEELEKYKTLKEAKKNLNSKDWISYFENAEKYAGKVKDWENEMKKLNRKIIFFNKGKIKDEFKVWVNKELTKNSIDQEFLKEVPDWDKLDIRNRSVYEIVNYSEVRNVELDSIYVGMMTFSKIGFNKRTNRAVLYYDWFCGGLCGWGDIVIIIKNEEGWEIEEVINVWIS